MEEDVEEGVMGKKYSVLMSVYAKEKPEFLRESMMSMYEQTVPTDDFVLVCDGPLNDGLDKVIDEMQKKFGKSLRVFRLEKNQGLGLALRFGVEKCKNELIARMDSDDISKDDRIEKQLEVFAKMDVDVVGSNIVEYDESMKKQLSRRNVPKKNEDIMRMFKKRNSMNHMTVIFRKDKVLMAGNYQKMPLFEDYYLWIRMAECGCIFYNLQEALVKVRGGTEMFKRRGGIEYFRDTLYFQKVLREKKIISGIDFAVNVFERSIVAIMPNNLRNAIYLKVLRGKV